MSRLTIEGNFDLWTIKTFLKNSSLDYSYKFIAMASMLNLSDHILAGKHRPLMSFPIIEVEGLY